MGLFRSLVPYCIVLLVVERQALKSPTLILKLSVSPFNSAKFCFMFMKLYYVYADT